jgi:hypothetical protein
LSVLADADASRHGGLSRILIVAQFEKFRSTAESSKALLCLPLFAGRNAVLWLGSV